VRQDSHDESVVTCAIDPACSSEGCIGWTSRCGITELIHRCGRHVERASGATDATSVHFEGRERFPKKACSLNALRRLMLKGLADSTGLVERHWVLCSPCLFLVVGALSEGGFVTLA